MQLLFTTPISRASIDGGQTLTGVNLGIVTIDPDALTATARVSAIEDGMFSVHPRFVTVSVTGGETLTQVLAAFKAAIASALNVTFQ